MSYFDQEELEGLKLKIKYNGVRTLKNLIVDRLNINSAVPHHEVILNYICLCQPYDDAWRLLYPRLGQAVEALGSYSELPKEPLYHTKGHSVFDEHGDMVLGLGVRNAHLSPVVSCSNEEGAQEFAGNTVYNDWFEVDYRCATKCIFVPKLIAELGLTSFFKKKDEIYKRVFSEQEYIFLTEEVTLIPIPQETTDYG